MPLIRRSALACALSVLLSCAGPFAPDPETGPPFVTSESTYVLRPTQDGVTVDIAFKFVNRTGAAIFVLNCNRITSLHLEQGVGGVWTFAWAGAVPDCLSPPIELRVGDVFSDTLHVFAGDPSGPVEPKFEVHPVTGRYRLVWNALFWSPEDATFPYGAEIAKELRTSEPFEIVEP